MDWSVYLRQTLEHYDEPLLRRVAGNLFRPRNQWPPDELIERSVATVENAPVVDRRLECLEPASRRLLALIGHSRQPRWRVGPLLEMLAALGHADGPRPIFDLFDAGLLYPDVGPSANGSLRLKDFEQWLGQASTTGLLVFAHPDVTSRLLRTDLGLPACPGAVVRKNAPVHEADGLEWPLRLAVLWQQAVTTPFRRTQQGDFFKRDLERLRNDPLLAGPAADPLGELSDPGLWTVTLGLQAGVVREAEAELQAGQLPAVWDDGLLPTLADLWQALPLLQAWASGEAGPADMPFASTYLPVVMLLAQLPPDGWAEPAALEGWLVEHHPWWSGRSRGAASAVAVVLGLASRLRIVQSTPAGKEGWLVRLGPVGRWLVGLADPPATPAAFPQTLTVQPNLEIVAFRQGLTPGLIKHLTLFAAWQGIGPACTLQLRADSVHRALEAGQSFDSIRLTLERHGTRGVPAAVLDSLRTWANKRERIAVFPAATLFEFPSAADLTEAIARGLPGTRITDRLALVAGEGSVDFRHFRLMGTRDYSLPPDRCVEVDADGVTIHVDLTRSDLLVEPELQRCAEPVDKPMRPAGDKASIRTYRLTPASVASARASGMSARGLDEWFLQRSGAPLSAAGRLLLGASQLAPVELRRRLILSVPTPEIADGLLQLPETAGLIEARLGPTSLVIAETNVTTFRQRLGELGVEVHVSV